MRLLAALSCALFACAPAHGGQTEFNLSVGNPHQPSTVALAIDGGPTIAFVDADSIPDGIAWKPVRYSFAASSGATRIAVSNGRREPEVPVSGIWLLTIVGLGLIGGRLWYRVLAGRT